MDSLDFLRTIHCVKNVRIRSFSVPCFPAFGLNTLYSVQMRENSDQKIAEYGHFLRSELYRINYAKNQYYRIHLFNFYYFQSWNHQQKRSYQSFQYKNPTFNRYYIYVKFLIEDLLGLKPQHISLRFTHILRSWNYSLTKTFLQQTSTIFTMRE